jgi:hypothetical protein
MARGTWEGSGTWKSSGGGGGGLVLAVIAAAVLIGSGAASVMERLFVTITIVLGAVIGLAVLGAAAVLVHRARSEGRRRPVSARPVSRVPPGQHPQLEIPHKTATPEFRNGVTELRAIEPPQLHLHIDGADPQVIAAIMRHLTKEE